MKNYITYLFLLILLFLSSCKTKERIVEVEVPKIKTEIKYIDKLQHDSVFVKDSVFIYQKGDTVYNNIIQYKYKYKYLRDTVNINKTDTITKIQKITEIKTKNELNTVQKILMYIGLFAIVFFIIIIYKQFKN